MFHTAPATLAPPAPIAPGDLRRHLRAATAPVHAALDRRFADLLDPAARDYRAFLRMNHACHGLLEAWLAEAGPATRRSAGDGPAPQGPVLPAEIAALRPSFTAALAADMAAMGLAPLPPEGLAARLASLRRGLPEAAGVVYVLDGSRLGARMILKEWRGRREASGRSSVYLTAAAAASVPVFAAFDALSAHLDPGELERTVAAAQTAFKLFEGASVLTIDGGL